ncbi:MAG: hypothetical protein IIB00_02995 [candidate division Zixibacteria bacterium]|nr:hypothetical protein [candidate division Zixibacteria bacterium]
MKMKICIGKTKSGGDCKARPISGSDYCFFHDPKSASKQREARGVEKAAGKAG